MKQLLLLCAAFFFAACACTKNIKKSELPPETQEGKNTFGCMVDNKGFIPATTIGWGAGPLVVNLSYSQKKFWRFYLSAVRKVINSSSYISITIEDKDFFTKNKKYKLTIPNAYGEYIKQRKFYSVGVDGELVFTRIDTIAKVASGKFSFVAENADKERVNISEGRFDVKL